MTIITVAGARPNFVKIAPLCRAFAQSARPIRHMVCHTGQHFDDNMSRVFFEQLGLPAPDFDLGVGGGSHAVQTARVMERFEAVAMREKPDLVVVVGDVNSTLAAGLTAAKLGIPVAHVEAGLRSFDRTMPEEINREVTDLLSDYLFVSEPSGLRNIEKEGLGAAEGKGRRKVVAFVGNVMIDSLVHSLDRVKASPARAGLGLQSRDYIVATLHRPSNVDDPVRLRGWIDGLNRMAASMPVVFPVHPRTAEMIRRFGFESLWRAGVRRLEPQGYIEMLALLREARLVITDSGGIQEETTFLGVPCVTARAGTERPVTVDVGTNYLAGTSIQDVERIAAEILRGNGKQGTIPDLWDGKAAERIVKILLPI